MKKQIPNLITLGNLLCGVLAAYCAANDRLHLAALLICLGILLDFFDGMTARLLGVSSPIGKELDSLADVVTSGVAPGFIVFKMIQQCAPAGSVFQWIALVALLIPLFAAYRLAKFNLDTRQSHSFLGLPVPSNALIWVGLALSLGTATFDPIAHQLWFVVAVIAVSLLTDILMVSELPMFSLKFNFKDLTWRTNSIPYIFLIGCALIIALTRHWFAISIIILWYILFSFLTRNRQHA